MARMRHGDTASLSTIRKTIAEVHSLTNHIGLAAAPIKIYRSTPYDYLFPRLQSDKEAVFDADSGVVEGLKNLGQTMTLDSSDPVFDSPIPSAYTYFGQFVAHDISFEMMSDELSDLNRSDLMPLSAVQIRDQLENRRSPTLDLDSIYGVTGDGEPVPRNCEKLSVGTVCYREDAPMFAGTRPPNKDINNDVPRKPPSPDVSVDREALIGDTRNDENLILSQLHVTFLRAHNTLVKGGLSFAEAKKVLTEHYQWLVIKEFLGRILDREIRSDILTYGNKFFRPPICRIFMPLEFSAAAFRFGHSMVRRQYVYNTNFQEASLQDLMTVPTFRGLPATVDRLPEQWIIEWPNFLDGGANRARQIDTRLVDPLAALRDKMGNLLTGSKSSLAQRNLLRSYLLRIPTGQKIAQACGLTPLTGTQILDRAAGKDQRDVLIKHGFHEKTPLWYYVLTEAANRGCLGPVGSTIVGETVIGLVRWTEDSILSQSNWKPTLGAQPGEFSLKDLFTLAGSWN